MIRTNIGDIYLLAAHAIGLGAVKYVQERMKYLSRIFDLPDNIKPMAVISIGYPAEEKGPADRFTDAKVNWQFTTDDARIKLSRLYPTLED